MSTPCRTILIVDDLPQDSYGDESTFFRCDRDAYNILTEQYHPQVLSLCQAIRIDGILLEFHPPYASSVNFLRDLKQHMGDACPPLVVIGDDNLQVAVQTLKAGAADYLVRDQITPADLQLTLHTAIENAELRQALQRSERLFQASVETLQDCFGIFTAVRDESDNIVDFKIDYLNQAAVENNKMPREEQIGCRLCEVLPGHHTSGLFDDYCRLVETGEPVTKDSLIYEDTYGGARQLVRAFDIRAARLNDGFVASWRDITQRKILEIGLNQTIVDLKKVQCQLTDAVSANQEIRGVDSNRAASMETADERYQTLFEAMEDGFCIIQMLFDENDRPVDYRFLEINPAFERQTGLAQAVGKTARQLLPDLEDHWFEIYGDVAITRNPVRFENSSEVMNRWFEVHAFPIGIPEQRKVALLFREISDRKCAELEKEQLLEREHAARAEAERINRIKDEFLAVLSHELRSPLNPILGWAKLLQTRTFDSAKTARALSTIERNARLQAQLVDDLLDVARILRGKLKLNNVWVNMAVTARAAIDAVRTSATAKAIRIQFWVDGIEINDNSLPPEIAQSLAFQILGDPTRLQQILLNLLSNAIKFTPSKGQISIRVERVDDQVRLTVTDTGKGISLDFLPHIFDSFRQEDISVTRKHGGLGLGLAIVEHLVGAHGGTIGADSPGEGLGATFTVCLPAPPLESAANTVQPQLPNPNLAGTRVLVVDDDPDTREFLMTLLNEYDVEVLTVESASEALVQLEVFQPQVLISDIGMPDMDGNDLIQHIRSLPSEQGGQIPAIALTAYVREGDRHDVLANGYQKHVPKPIEFDQLIQAIATLVHPGEEGEATM